MSGVMDPPIGSIVTVPQGRGVVRFKGPTSFMTSGKWVGIELYEKNGKNDGSVEGIAYFKCEMGYGVFVRPSQIRSIHGSELDNLPSPRLPSTARPAGLGHQRTPSSSSLLRRNSVNIKSQPSSNASTRSASPAKPSTSLAVPPSLSRSTARPPPVSTSSLTSPLQHRKSLITRHSPSQDIPPSSPNPASRNGSTSPVKPSASSQPYSVKRTSSPLSQPPLQTISQAQRPPSRLASSPPPSPPPTEPAPPPPQPPPPHDDTELQELRAKIRVLEAKRTDESRHIRELETRLADTEAFVAARPKLQAKLTSLQSELIATRRELADAQQLSQLAESRVIDAQEQLEMVMLDKEVAEERAELAEAELEDVKEKLAILEVEVDVLKEEGAETGDTPAKDSMAYIQLEKQNERLKEALIKLRDMTQESEQEQRRRISEMEKDVSDAENLQASYDEAMIKLANAETQIEDLKLQLDDALTAEDMLVRLTERNLVLGEKIEEMRITIEDLEALKELSDELEENHTETEKQLHEDLEAKESQIRELQRKIDSLEETCQDYEGTIQQFRDLVMQLQTDLDQLRTQTQTAQSESASAASQAANIMSLNLKLQSSAQKNQARTIDLEVKSIEAKECRELLNIVQPYLPQLYVESDSDATSCYLFFRRMGYKADLINNVVAHIHNLPEALNGDVTDTIVGVCEMRGRISGLSTLCKRFAAVLRRCDVETFLNIGRLYPEIAPLEKRIDMHIDLLRRDEFRDMECVNDIVKIQAQFDHLAETYFDGFDTDLAERELGYVTAFDHDLDMFAASIGLTRTSVASVIKEDDITLEMGGYDIDQELFEPLLVLINRCKSAKTLSKKLIKRLEDLAQDSAAVKPHIIPQMKALSNYVAEMVNFGISLAQQILPHLKDVRALKCPFQLTSILAVVKQSATSTVAPEMKPGASAWEAVGDFISLLIEESTKLVQPVSEPENVLKITGIAPWVARVAEIKAALAVNVEAERKVSSLNDEIQGLARTLRTKDQTIQESTVKIELMERRLEAVKKQADTIVELENELAKARKQERAYEEAMEQLQADLDTLEQDNAKLKTMTAGQERQSVGPMQVETENVPVEGSLETSHLLEQIEALRGTVRFLRTENSYLKGHDLLREIETLPPLPRPVARTPTPPLVVSGNSDTEDSDAEDPPPAPTVLSLSTETKRLYREVMEYSSAPRVVDLSVLNAKRAEAKGGKVWLPRKQMPGQQVLERRLQGERLSRRVQGLLEKARAL
ncbi:Dynactin, 150 kDa isoform [Psilocybe cubensis]|uniref:CAP-Gly domain-containing protein n=2 Tax=Psilocybe cubensis TaxID=181762 RepID=A0A8H7Y974_PSICU|nr:Dynactin, 150 kDa isoform [Psilocybe cubensis]KAH9486203.1 Dynactin, 150 kDa isoform [Psilocybe cubensis]